MNEWEYSQIEGPPRIPPCPECKTAMAVDRIGLVDQGGRYHCRNCQVTFVAKRRATVLPTATKV